MSSVSELTTEDFDAEVLHSGIPVLVDFHAVWCGPCKAVAPVLEDLAREFEGEVRIVKVDVDAEPELPKTYGVQGIPTLILFSKGKEVERHAGGLTRGRLSAIFERHLENAE